MEHQETQCELHGVLAVCGQQTNRASIENSYNGPFAILNEAKLQNQLSADKISIVDKEKLREKSCGAHKPMPMKDKNVADFGAIGAEALRRARKEQATRYSADRPHPQLAALQVDHRTMKAAIVDAGIVTEDQKNAGLKELEARYVDIAVKQKAHRARKKVCNFRFTISDL